MGDLGVRAYHRLELYADLVLAYENVRGRAIARERLENAYRKLGVTDRRRAVARVLGGDES